MREQFLLRALQAAYTVETTVAEALHRRVRGHVGQASPVLESLQMFKEEVIPKVNTPRKR